MWRNWTFGTGFMPWSIYLAPWIVLIIIIELILKGVALYRAARNGQTYWFIAILILNTAGILPLVYLLLYPQQRKK